MTATIKKFICLCVMLLLCAVPAWSTEYNVSTIDALRSTISSASAGDIINLAAGTYDLTSTLSINKTITLRGNTSSDTIIQRSSSATSQFSNITISDISANMVILQNLTIRNASADTSGGGILYTANGTLSIDNCIITNNAVGANCQGGGIYNESGAANITNCTITDNTSNNGEGGGISNYGTATITNCTITDNTANSGKEIYDDFGGSFSALNTLI